MERFFLNAKMRVSPMSCHSQRQPVYRVESIEGDGYGQSPMNLVDAQTGESKRVEFEPDTWRAAIPQWTVEEEPED